LDKKYKLFVFDMDGVIVDSMPALRELGICLIQIGGGFKREHAERCYDATVGHPFRTQVMAAFPDLGLNDLHIKDVVDAYTRMHTIMAPMFPIVEDWEDLVHDFFKMEVSIALVSSTHKDIVLEMVQLPDFDYLGGWTLGFTKDKQIIDACYHLDISSDQAMLFGDSKSDADCAADVGCDFTMTSFEKMSEDVNDVLDSMNK